MDFKGNCSIKDSAWVKDKVVIDGGWRNCKVYYQTQKVDEDWSIMDRSEVKDCAFTLWLNSSASQSWELTPEDSLLIKLPDIQKGKFSLQGHFSIEDQSYGAETRGDWDCTWTLTEKLSQPEPEKKTREFTTYGSFGGSDSLASECKEVQE